MMQNRKQINRWLATSFLSFNYTLLRDSHLKEILKLGLNHA